MPILSGIFKSSEKSLNKVESEISNENIKVVSVENIEKLKDDNKSLLSELIPIAKKKKSNQCFQLHTYDNVYIRRVIHPIKEEVPKMERRKSLKNELFKNLRINTIISGIKGSLNSAPVKEDNKNNKNSSKNGPKTAALEKNFENLKIDEEDESESQTLLNNSNNNSDNSNTNNDNNNNNNSDNNNSNNSDNNNNNNSDNDTNNKSDNNNNNNSNNNNNYSNNSSMILSETDIDMNQSLNRLSEENLKYIDKKQHEGVKSTSTISKTNNDSLSVIHENEITINSINEIDRNMSYHSDNDLPKKKENKVELTIDTSQPKEKKKKKLYTILTPSSKSLPWLKEKKKSKKNEIVSASVLENKDVNSPLNENKSQSGHHSANTFNSNQSSATSITLINSGGISNDNRYSDMEDGGNTPSSTTSSNNETPIKSPKKKKLYFNKEGMVIEKVDATDIRIVSKMYNEYKEDFHKRVEFDFICTEYRKKASYNYYLYSPTDLIYNDSKAFFFYEPTISIGSLKDILKNSKGFKDEMDIYVEEMLCTFKKLVNVVNWLHSTYQIVHRRIEPSILYFDIIYIFINKIIYLINNNLFLFYFILFYFILFYFFFNILNTYILLILNL